MYVSFLSQRGKNGIKNILNILIFSLFFPFFFLFFKKKVLFINFGCAVSLLLCAGFVPSCGKWGLSSVVVHRLLTVVTSLVSKSHCGSQALQYGLSNYGTGLNCSMACGTFPNQG